MERAVPRCVRMVPSNGADFTDLALVPATPFVVPGGRTFTIDTDTGRIVSETGAVVRLATVGGGLDEGTGTYFGRRTESVALFAIDSLVVETRMAMSFSMTRAGRSEVPASSARTAPKG
jgi:hypothetical protein